jgi:aspartate/methionine/tyrosine aminotransferase
LFSDEVYRGLEYDPADRLPAACDLYENAVSLGVLSKTYGLPGLRIGWIATHNRDLYERMAAFKDYLSICNSAPSEFLAIVATRHAEALAARGALPEAQAEFTAAIKINPAYFPAMYSLGR